MQPRPIRQTIDHTADRVPIDDQVAEMLTIIAETEFDLQRRVAADLITPMQATDRRRRRHAVLATVKWIQENREAILDAHRAIKEGAAAEAAKIVEEATSWGEEDLTGEE